MKDKKIYLDSGIMVSLGLIHDNAIKYLRTQQSSKSGYEKLIQGNITGDFDVTEKGLPILQNYVLGNIAELTRNLEKESVNISDQDAIGLCFTYISIMKKEVVACAVPIVYKEICADPKGANSAELTKKFFNHCHLAIPKNEDDYIEFADRTAKFAESLKSVDYAKTPDSKDRYGLAEDIHTKQGEEPVDINDEDRCLVSQLEQLSRLGDENIEYVSGFDVMTGEGKYNKKNKYVSYNNIALGICDDTKLMSIDKTFRLNKTYDFNNEGRRKRFLFLHENEKDFGRMKTKDRKRSFKFSNENTNRNADLMQMVAIELSKRLNFCEMITPDNELFMKFINNEIENNDELETIISKAKVYMSQKELTEKYKLKQAEKNGSKNSNNDKSENEKQ